MTPDQSPPEAPAPTRRARRMREAAQASGLPAAPSLSRPGEDPTATTPAPTEGDERVPNTASEEPADAAAVAPSPEAQWADAERTATALVWVDERTLSVPAAAAADGGPDLLADARLRRGILQPRFLAPLGVLTAFATAYAATTLLWPLHEVTPTVTAERIEPAAAAAATPTWPAQGSAAVGIAGMSSLASAVDPASIASITKVVSVMMVLDRLPLQPGEQGPSFDFTWRDSDEFWDYMRSNQSALDVPVDGSLTEYQMLQGVLLGSANNYIDRLARELWGSDREFARAAAQWLRERGIDGITIVTPSGFDEGNVATPEALLKVGEWAMKNPVFAEIVATPAAELPGVGTVTNTNGMLADAGVTGIKTGTLVGWSLLTAKEVPVGDTTVTLYAAVLNQDDDEQRLAVTRSLFAEIEAALAALEPAVDEETVVGRVSTVWGAEIDVVTDADATVALWNGALATTDVVFDLGDARAAGDEVGTLRVVGPVDETTVTLSLAEDLPDPSPWWRLTHPLELFGLDD